MRRLCLLLVVLGSVSAWPAAARAGAYADQLAQCLIRATTPADQKIVVRWAFATMALDPDVAAMASVTPAQRAAINQRAGALVTDLLTQSCSQPVQQTLMFEGTAGAESAFEAWGRWAVTGLVSEPHVAQGMGELLQYIDIGKLMSLVPLQGLPPMSSGTR
ncbi:MAG: hypothetical protein OJF55_002371 [Rhodanobacteraceae bacterium]|jgi:hypothetical protein|nr:MAG: hypothetical protein OJF55_002371 [Rhodanobacteraceae bacterium]